MDLFQDAHMSVVFEPHDSGPCIPDHNLLESQHALDFSQSAFTSEHTLESVE